MARKDPGPQVAVPGRNPVQRGPHDIHAWLQSLPRAQDEKSIPLLNP